ncbi:helix-turn-helix transcriptional regulator [Pseudonocardia sulfidoxydans]|nr:helix-turn-helix domain-containing protein [Pseudonocardia sulfidoxydans]
MSDVIRQRRAALGLSQADLARAAGVDTRQIRRYEAGEQQPLLLVAVAIADALHISVEDLARGSITDGSAARADGERDGLLTHHGPVRVEESDTEKLVTFTGSEEADLLRAAGAWIDRHPFVVVVGINWMGDFLSPHDVDFDHPLHRMDMVVNLSGEISA